MKKIYNKDIRYSNYATFGKCDILTKGKIFRFVFACGATYDVPIDYFLKWNSNPHYIYKKGRWVVWQSNKHRKASKKVKSSMFVRYRRILGKTAVKIFLNDGTAFVIPWDTVLMACERRYEQFGGLTEKSKIMADEFFKSGRSC